MEEKEENCARSAALPPKLEYVRVAPGLGLRNHALLRPLPVCCARIASPYWARVIGSISNKRAEEAPVRIVATLLGSNGEVLGEHSDFMILGGGDNGEFDVKITSFYEDVRAYGLEVTDDGGA